jgi:hypothetical protein
MVSSRTTTRTVRVAHWVLDALEQEASEQATTVSALVTRTLELHVTGLGYVETPVSES